ncbi:MAG: hypothetical protein ACO2PN_01665 [Pyrobaculum sp.]
MRLPGVGVWRVSMGVCVVSSFVPWVVDVVRRVWGCGGCCKCSVAVVRLRGDLWGGSPRKRRRLAGVCGG